MTGGLIKARKSADAALEQSTAVSPPAWSYAPQRDQRGEGGVPWSRYIAALRRYKWVILAVIVIGTALGVAATRLLKPIYEVHATIWISDAETRYGRSEERGPIRADELVNPTAWIELFKSFAVLDSVVTKMSLFKVLDDPRDSGAFTGFELGERFRPGSYALTADASGQRYVLATEDGLEIERGTIGDSVGRRVGFRWTPTAESLERGGTIRFRIVNPRHVSIELQSRVLAVLPQ